MENHTLSIPLIQVGKDIMADARVWCYTSNRIFEPNEQALLEKELATFCSTWDSHGTLLRAEWHIVLSRIIVLVADESNQMVSGCSVDKSIAFFRKVERNLGLDLFNRFLLTGMINGEWKTLPMDTWSSMISSGEVHGETLFVDTLVDNCFAVRNHFIQKLQSFRLRRLMGFPQVVQRHD